MSDAPRHRDGMGRFMPGNPGGPGRKPRKVEEEYLQSMTAIVDAEAWESIVRKATLDAIAGDAKARTWITNYLLGQPIARAEPYQPSRIEMLMGMFPDAGREASADDDDDEAGAG
jgi:hypothetical protein